MASDNETEDICGHVKLKSEMNIPEKRKEYMREYMRNYRQPKKQKSSSTVRVGLNIEDNGTNIDLFPDSSDTLSNIHANDENPQLYADIQDSDCDSSPAWTPVACDHFDDEDAELVLHIQSIEEKTKEFMYAVDDVDFDPIDLTGVAQQNAESKFLDDLRLTIDQSKMKPTQIDAILSLLHRHHDVVSVDVPKSYKTLMKTHSGDVVGNNFKIVSDHEYVYYPLANQLCYTLSRYPEDALKDVSVLELIWNTDGFPIHKSTSKSSWPVLCFVSNLRPRYVFEVVVTCGKGKPSNLDYLNEFLTDLKQIMSCGLKWKERLFRITVKAVVCDAPARAAIKGVVQFSGKHGCDHCEKIGVHDGHRVVWVGCADARPRTDESFRSKSSPLHHKTDSPLLNLDIDMILQFPPDFMHQAGGTMRKILLWLLKGPRLSGDGVVVCD